MGHEVRAVTAPPYYPQWRRPPEYAALRYYHERWRGTRVWRAPIWVPRNPSGSARVLHLLSFAATSWPLMLRQLLWRPEIVLVVAPTIASAPMGWVVARLTGATAWLHLQDFEVEVAFKLGLLRRQRLQQLMLTIERHLLRRFDRVSTISGRMFERLLSKGVEPERTFLFPNWVDLSLFDLGKCTQRMRSELSISPNAIVVLYSGTLAAKQGLEIVPAVARLLLDRAEIIFVVGGDGLMKPQLQQASVNLPNLRLLPLQPADRLGELLGMADIHLLPQSPAAADLVLPSKLSGMLASGRPVISTCAPGTELAEVVAGCGLVVPPEDASAMAKAVLRLAEDEPLRHELGRRARLWAERNIEQSTVLNRAFDHALLGRDRRSKTTTERETGTGTAADSPLSGGP